MKKRAISTILIHHRSLTSQVWGGEVVGKNILFKQKTQRIKLSIFHTFFFCLEMCLVFKWVGAGAIVH